MSKHRMQRLGVVLLGIAVLASVAGTAHAADTAPPSLTITSPEAGAVVSGTITVRGTASDASGIRKVVAKVDRETQTRATGTTSWTWTLDTRRLTDGPHKILAKAFDNAGLKTRRAVWVTVANGDTVAPTIQIAAPSHGASVRGSVTVSGSAADNKALSKVTVAVNGGMPQPVSGTTDWSYALDTTGLPQGSNTVSAAATDAAGNVSKTTADVYVDNTTSDAYGMTVSIDSQGAWTTEQIKSMLSENALASDGSVIGPRVTVKVQDTYPSSASASVGWDGQSYANFTATIFLKGVDSTFAAMPDSQVAHEYGHVWSIYHLYMSNSGSWTSYLDARGLAGDSRLNKSYVWTTDEIIAEDYRLLFGSPTAVDQRPTHMNPDIPDPRNVPGLRDFLLNSWAK